MAGGRETVARCWKRIPSWTKVDLAMLACVTVGLTVFIVTLYCVWYPYLQTASFIQSSCGPARYVDTNILYTCTDENCYTSGDTYQCPYFPCVRVTVQWWKDYVGGGGMLYSNYDQLLTYPNVKSLRMF